MTRVIESLMDRKFGKLTVISFDKRDKNGTYWLCQCECRKQKVIQAGHLKAGLIKSCGCFKRPKSLFPTKEGLSFNSARNRCNNPNDPAYDRYGGRGIKFLFSSIQELIDHIGLCPVGTERYSLDRIDNDGNYEMGNVRWGSAKEQANNRRSNVNLTFNGRTQNVNDWVKETGIKRSTFAMRLRLGWTVEDTITTPVKKQSIKINKMKGYLKQLNNNDGNNIMLLLFPVDIEEEIIKVAYLEYLKDEDSLDFDEWWNEKNPKYKTERMFVDDININGQ